MKISKSLIVLCTTILTACTHIQSANIYDISCSKHDEEGEKNYISSCKLGIEAENLGKLIAARCYGEVTVTGIMENEDYDKFDYGFLQSYKFGQQTELAPKTYTAAMIYFPDGWQIIKVENNWSKCEKQY